MQKKEELRFKAATNSILKAVFQQEIELGERFNIGELNYIVTEKIANYVYKIKCESLGTIGNTQFGELEPIDYIEDYVGGEITEIIVAGTDQEETEIFRERIFETFARKSFGGNKATYKEYFSNINGVGGVKVKRRNSESEYIEAVFITSTYSTPSNELIDEIQTLIDPTQNGGEGDGFAPICHKVHVSGVESIEINTTTEITFDTDYTYEDLESQIKSAIDQYFLELSEVWSESEYLIVRITQIQVALLKINGIIDVKNTTLNGLAENVILGENKIPIRGDFSAI